MSAIPAMDLLGLPLEGTTLVEASAGTGKTHTIATLFVRLVLEKGFSVSEILVVTYTRAATAELRLRIRRRLVEALDCFDACESGLPGVANLERDRDLVALAERAREAGHLERGRTRLQDALRQFDEASIATIHGFCQRVLAGYTFESGAAFDQSLLEDDRLLIREVVQDFWSNQLCDGSESFVAHLRARSVTTDSLALLVERALSHPDVVLVPEPELEARATELLRTRFATSAARVQELWVAHAPALIEVLTDGRFPLNRYRPEQICGAWSAELSEIAQFGTPPLPKWFERLTPQQLQPKKGKVKPNHVFFDACGELHAAAAALLTALDVDLVTFRHALLAYARSELTRRKAQAAELGFDDLLLQLRAALRGARGEGLIARLRTAHPAALIDEFQDTDPVQCEIFQRVYAPERPEPGSLLLVGDPKQAIYAFRGADIFAYLAAAAAAPRVSLPVNHRSDPRLLRALNTLWARVERPFVWPEISYQPVAAPSGARDRLHGPLGKRAPLEITFIPRTAIDPENLKPIAKGRLDFRLPELVAAEIVRTLESKSWLGSDPEKPGEPLAPRHIAVLCRTNRQAQRVQAELRKLHVPAVLDGDASVFDSQMAVEVERVMAAMAEPGQANRVRAALATSMLGVRGDELANLENDEAAWDEWVGTFHALCELWQARGFIRAMHALLDRYRVAKRLLSRDDGERRYTDLMHLVELLHAEALRSRSGPLALLEWHRRMREGDRERSGLAAADVQIRLESDAEAVTLTTIHKSKGLEYPIVFCPFSWDGSLLRGQDKEHPRFHDPQQAHRLTLDLGSQDGAPAAEHLERAKREALSEELRLLYVALTRAKHRVSVVWGAFASAEGSALGYVLHQAGGELADDRPERTAARIESLSDADLRADLEALATAAEGAVEVTIASLAAVQPWAAGVAETPALSARTLVRSPVDSVRSSSFSRLIAEADLSLPALEGLDRDEAAPVETPEPLLAERPRVLLADFVAGASFGHLVHSLYEHSDFRVEGPEALIPTVAAGLAAYGMTTASPEVLASAIFETLRTPLTVGGLELPSLSVVAPSARVNELEFVFPLPEPAAAALVQKQQELFARASVQHDFSAKRLASLLATTGESALERAYADRLRMLGFNQVTGFVRGFMDLVVQHDGKYYLIDYKSNHLGEHAEDYAPARLQHVMIGHHYVLQALIYGVALHRYLQLRLPGYSYAQHFGGVYYLFVRGMSPSHPLGSGVHAERPTRALIEAFDALLGRVGAA
ncbi:MAG TPA: exodeoxyribonuclease V subunit beta [Polyangiales bacterium]|nr:exodeoxyribonuclease V subunit beta [Polyangiales bacterium]